MKNLTRLLMIAVAAGLWIAPAGEAKTVKVNWQEYKGLVGGKLQFHVTKIVVTPRSWSVSMTVTNASPYTIAITKPPTIPAGPFKGLWDYRVAGFGLAAYAPPSRVSTGGWRIGMSDHATPSIPSSLGPRASWKGVFSGKTKVPQKTELRLTFGLFTITDAPDESKRSVGTQFSWLTDHRFRL